MVPYEAFGAPVFQGELRQQRVLYMEIDKSGDEYIVKCGRAKTILHVSQGDVQFFNDQLVVASLAFMDLIEQKAGNKEILDLTDDKAGEKEIVDTLLDPAGLASAGSVVAVKVLGEQVMEHLRDVSVVAEGEEPPVMEIWSDSFFVAWELLFLASPESLPKDAKLKEVLNEFLGARLLVARGLHQWTEKISIYDLVRRAPVHVLPVTVLFLHNPELPYARRELRYLRSQEEKGRIRLMEPPPWQEVKPRRLVPTVKDLINEIQPAVVHFACDGRPRSKGRDACFVFAEHLVFPILQLTSLPPVFLRNDPLAILNACSTGIRRPAESFGFSQILLAIGCRSVVAVENVVDDRIATGFVKEIYERLLSELPLSHAVYWARSEFIREVVSDAFRAYALFYSLYGDPDWRLSAG